MANNEKKVATFTLRIEEPLLEKLRENQRKNLVPVAAFIRRAVEEKLEREFAK
jgi:hypothetical protein